MGASWHCHRRADWQSTGSLLCRGLAIDWQSARLPNAIRRNPDASGPVCATSQPRSILVAVPRCAPIGQWGIGKPVAARIRGYILHENPETRVRTARQRLVSIHRSFACIARRRRAGAFLERTLPESKAAGAAAVQEPIAFKGTPERPAWGTWGAWEPFCL